MGIQTKVLENKFVRLEPHAEAHRDGLRAAAKADAPLFAFMPADISGSHFDRWFDWTASVSDGKRELAFSVIDTKADRIVGSTRYLNIELPHKRVEIGHTFYARDSWGGVVNPSCKSLLFAFAFDDLKLNRVELKCDARNSRSRAAILKLGAKEEGTLRQHMIMSDGFVRDTVYFSVVATEWPSVMTQLQRRIAAF
ncbi:MAG: GNAT family N-acetyltransferase [Alphaproteobacteria bacterium]|nr:GNAT family N-acetyltransferase [Alphaproteobacteria bacterium]